MQQVMSEPELRAYMEAQIDLVRAEYGECNDRTLTEFVRSGQSERFRKAYEQERMKEN